VLAEPHCFQGFERIGEMAMKVIEEKSGRKKRILKEYSLKILILVHFY